MQHIHYGIALVFVGVVACREVNGIFDADAQYLAAEDIVFGITLEYRRIHIWKVGWILVAAA